MNLRRYIQGDRKGKEANRIEREAMKDPFLADALEGYERLGTPNVKRISEIRKDIKFRTKKRHTFIRNFSIAASFLLCLGFGTYFLLQINKPDSSVQIAQSRSDISDIQEEEVEVIHQDSAVNEIVALAEPAPPVQEPEILSAVTEDILVADEAEQAKESASVQHEMAAAKSATDQTSQPVIGDKEYEKYLKDNLKYPTDDACKEARGEVTIVFNIDTVGKPYNFSVKKSLCRSADEEAIRLIKEGPKWTTGNREVSVIIKF